MRTYRFYVNMPLHISETVILPSDIQHHLKTVLKKNLYTFSFIVFNGDGKDYLGRMLDHQYFLIEEAFVVKRESPVKIHLGQCLSKSQYFEVALQKATELGVTEITPIYSDFSEKYALKTKIPRWQKIVTQACEQSGRAVIPKLNAPQEFNVFLEEPKDLGWIADPGGLLPADGTPSVFLKDEGSAALLIGPEGGFSDKERQLAVQKGFIGIKLGPRILRTETATSTFLTLLQYLYGDFSKID